MADETDETDETEEYLNQYKVVSKFIDLVVESYGHNIIMNPNEVPNDNVWTVGFEYHLQCKKYHNINKKHIK